MQRERLATHTEDEEDDEEGELAVNAGDALHDLHYATAANDAVETQSSTFSVSSSSFSSSAFLASSAVVSSAPSRLSRRRVAGGGRRAIRAAYNDAGASPSPFGSFSPCPSLSSPHVGSLSSSFSTSSSSPPPPHPTTTAATATTPATSSGNSAMLTVTRRSYQSPSRVSRGSKGRRRLVATTDTLTQPRASRPSDPRKSPQQQQQQQLIPWWRHWESVAVNLVNIPLDANTFTLWQAFKKEGHISSIDIFEDVHGNKETKGKVRFK